MDHMRMIDGGGSELRDGIRLGDLEVFDGRCLECPRLPSVARAGKENILEGKLLAGNDALEHSKDSGLVFELDPDGGSDDVRHLGLVMLWCRESRCQYERSGPGAGAWAKEMVTCELEALPL